MRLNNLKPAAGARSTAHRVGRGIGSGWGKTAGRGHKGQSSRAGGFHKVGFEGGQMPLHRRLPKRGFTSVSRRYVEAVRLSELQKLGAEEIDLMVLKQAGVISILAVDARVIKSGAISRKVSVRGIGVTKGAKAAIEAAGGTVAVTTVEKRPGKKEERYAARHAAKEKAMQAARTAAAQPAAPVKKAAKPTDDKSAAPAKKPPKPPAAK